MSYNYDLTDKIVQKAKLLGASIAGIAEVEALKASPSHRIYPRIGMNFEEYVKENLKADEIAWPSDAISVVVIGVAHNADKPELDWWSDKKTPGNSILIRINKELSEWIENKFSVKAYNLPYYIKKGGIFLKDAAVMAGLGSIGKNNLVITPEYGPRIRFRSLLLNRKIKPTGPLEFNPCEDCIRPCLKACPEKAFQNTIYSADIWKQSILPGIDGTYDRVACNVRMKKDIKKAVEKIPVSDKEHQEIKAAVDAIKNGIGTTPDIDSKKYDYKVKYCRRCELSCPVGK